MGITSIQETKQGWLKSWCRSYPTTSHLKWFLQQFSAIFSVFYHFGSLLTWLREELILNWTGLQSQSSTFHLRLPSFPRWNNIYKTGIPKTWKKTGWNINCGFLATPGENMWFEMLLCKSPWIKLRSSFWTLRSCRLRAVSYFSLQSYCTRNLSTAKPRDARNEGVVWSQSLIVSKN